MVEAARYQAFFHAWRTQDYLSVFPALVDGCNHSRNLSIGIAPKDVTEQNEKQVWQHQANDYVAELDLGSKSDKQSD